MEIVIQNSNLQLNLKSCAIEFLMFGAKEARACIFAGSFFVILAASKYIPLYGLPRYDFLLIAAVLLQIGLLATKLETIDELKTICLFHVIGLCLEIFKTHPAIGSWSYPEFAYSKVFGAPLYSGFMHAAVASYVVQAWRLFDLKLENYPSYAFSLPIAALVYLNFFTHHFIGDYRWWLCIGLILAFRKTTVYFTPYKHPFKMPLLMSFLLIGFFIWLAENIATFFGAWVYPNQSSIWQRVHFGKISSWALLVVITVIIVADLKHIKRVKKQTQPCLSSP
jgi:uncharacterized membrane protein YoaT (DUF817 family)